jgi:hypothetical protein
MPQPTDPREVSNVADANSVREGKIPDGYDDAVVDPKTGEVQLKRPSSGPSETNWPDANPKTK